MLYIFALKNLLSRKLRTCLALVGLAISLVGAISLISASLGLKESVNGTIALIQGLVVIKKNTLDPVFSRLPLAHKQEIEQIAHVKHAIPEFWAIATSVENTNTLLKGMGSALAVFGLDLDYYPDEASAGIYKRTMKKGRYLSPEDKGSSVVLISGNIAQEFSKDIGSSFKIGDESFTVVGIYETGSFFLDKAIILPMDIARLKNFVSKDVVSSFYIVLDDMASEREVEGMIEQKLPHVDAKNSNEWSEEFQKISMRIDIFLTLVSLIAIVVGTIGIINTMLMSVFERTVEFGVLRANGWTRFDILKLVCLESLFLGIIGGIIGCFVGTVVAQVIGKMLPISPITPPWFIALVFSIGVILGVIGGLFPAIRASRIQPIDAIRFG